MLKPADGEEGVKEAVVRAVDGFEAGDIDVIGWKDDSVAYLPMIGDCQLSGVKQSPPGTGAQVAERDRPAKVSLIDLSAWQATGSVGDLFVWKAILLGVVIFIAQKKLKWHPVIFIALSAVVGIVFKF